MLSRFEKPGWLEPTIRSDPDGYAVSVPTLAWGVHRMLRNLFADEAQAKGADATAEPSWLVAVTTPAGSRMGRRVRDARARAADR